jgi:uncharacterized RDD family membrane protein YckC
MHFAAPRSMPDAYMSAATAPALARNPDREVSPREAPLQMPSAQPAYQHPSQASLFRDVSGAPKVIPIPTLTPVRPIEREEPSQPKRAPKPRQAAPRHPMRRSTDVQQALDFNFHPAAGAEIAPDGRVQAVIYCDAPVAMPTHRLIAAAFDASMVLLAVGVFLGIFFLSGGDIELKKQNIPFFLGVIVVLSLFYRSLWCLANGDSPGLRFAGLRLVDFDGRTPDRDQRGMRQLAGLLSVISAGLGLVWALVDEESLTWHDHISKTFPTVG